MRGESSVTSRLAAWVGRMPHLRDATMPRAAVLVVAGMLVVVVGIGDQLTGNDVAFTLIYLAPIVLATWVAGRWGGFTIAMCSGLSGLLANQGHHPPLSSSVQAWNLIAEVGVFAAVVALLDALRTRLRQEAERAVTDPLTGLDNRRAFREAAEAEIERVRRHQRSFTVALLDLDDLKHVNDTQGHEAGDQVLKLVAEVLRGRLRATDSIARLGGDEFALLFPETTVSEAATIFGDLMEMIPSSMRGRGWPVGVSVGAVTFQSTPASLDDALRQADVLLYEAKRAGKGKLRHEAWPTP
jgi:diguanylate cyclase (GGDEF)-like protein